MFNSTRYTPKIYGWTRDLEKSINRYDSGVRLKKDKQGRPYLKQMRYADDTYCELGRFSNGERTNNILFGLLAFISMLISVGGLLYAAIFAITELDNIGLAFIWLCFIVAIVPFLSICTSGLTIRSLLLPADIPVRFNRQTGKVYVYDPQLNKHYFWFPWKVLMRMATPDIKVFEWDNLSAFSRRKGVVNELWLAACKPGTYEVIDYFLVCDAPALYDEWLWIMEYMAFARELSYKSEVQPTHWSHDINLRFASPIIWPEGVDKASKASSKAELAEIEKQYDLVGKMYPPYNIEHQA
ncbi:DUF6708 domain-containing protein [Gilliamella sp. wkB171]|uniref:DUF6708 domain-containing protein n=2 Tax=Gilliamella TaxID=1193503 RepID=UPI000813627D|nr:DUF6708 domain-containing protein [Gilliamella apicola]OCL19213.1 hypothetical protein A9G03_09660 [Gilliamella apicola]